MGEEKELSVDSVTEEMFKTGGIVAGKAAILAEGDALAREDITYLNPLPLFNPDGTVKE